MPNATLTFIPQDYCHLSEVRSKMKRIEGWLFSMSRKWADRKVGWVRVKSLSDGERQWEERRWLACMISLRSKKEDWLGKLVQLSLLGTTEPYNTLASRNKQGVGREGDKGRKKYGNTGCYLGQYRTIQYELFMDTTICSKSLKTLTR